MSALELKEYSRLIRDSSSLLGDLFLPGMAVGFSGDLGAGKTAFIRELVSLLVPEEFVTSPTYVLEHLYSGKDLTISHWDIYRLGEAPEDLLYHRDLDFLYLIEWPERDERVFESLDAVIVLEIDSPHTRTITLYRREV